MVWATVNSRSCFCWLHWASPSSAAKNIIHLISVLTIWWGPSIKSSLGLLGNGAYFNQHVLLTKLLAFALLHFVPQCQTCLLFWISLDFLLLHSNTLWWKGHPILVLVLGRVVGCHRISQIQLLQHQWLGHRLGLLWYWVVCLGNESRSFCHFWGSTQVLHFKFFCWLWGLLHFS